MAKQVEQNPSAGRINRTPAPDEVSHIRSPSGAGYGQNSDLSGASVAPGQRVVSPLGANLETSVDDPVMAAVIAGGVAGRDDRVPADSPNWQQRAVKDDPYPVAHGMAKRGPDSGSPGGSVPPKTGWNPGVQVRQPK